MFKFKLPPRFGDTNQTKKAVFEPSNIKPVLLHQRSYAFVIDITGFIELFNHPHRFLMSGFRWDEEKVVGQRFVPVAPAERKSESEQSGLQKSSIRAHS
jgi:hypothetical protein